MSGGTECDIRNDRLGSLSWGQESRAIQLRYDNLSIRFQRRRSTSWHKNAPMDVHKPRWLRCLPSIHGESCGYVYRAVYGVKGDVSCRSRSHKSPGTWRHLAEPLENHPNASRVEFREHCTRCRKDTKMEDSRTLDWTISAKAPKN